MLALTVGFPISASGNVGDAYKPALIFPENLGPNGEKYIAEAISHEVGNTLGLNHDGPLPRVTIVVKGLGQRDGPRLWESVTISIIPMEQENNRYQ